MLPVRKVIEHVCEKLMTERMAAFALEESSPNNINHNDNGASGKGSQSSKESNTGADKVELYCNDQRLDDQLDLRSVKHYIWKSGGDLVLYYMIVK